MRDFFGLKDFALLTLALVSLVGTMHSGPITTIRLKQDTKKAQNTIKTGVFSLHIIKRTLHVALKI